MSKTAFALATLLCWCIPFTHATIAAASPFPSAIAQSADSEEELPLPLAVGVRRDLAERLDIPPGKLRVTEATRQTWSDACLGLPQPEEMCAQVLTEGWEIVVSDGDREWVYRSDLAGDVLRLADSVQDTLPESVSKAVLQDLAQRAKLPESAFRIERAQPEIWSDGCLGLPAPGQICTEALVEGWQVTVANGNREWVYHTDESGATVRIDGSASKP